MKDEYRFVTTIHIDNQKFPEIEENNLGSLIANLAEKMSVARIKAFNIAIIDNIREIGRENGIDLLAVIDEEKLLNMVLRLEEQDKVLEIIKKYPEHHIKSLLHMADYWEKSHRKITKNLLENYDFPYEVSEFEKLVRYFK